MKKFEMAKMTNWYEPSMLVNIELKVVLSGTFGNYADRRELMAALANDKKNENDEFDELIKLYRTGKNEIWVDVVSDIGDGFNSTYSVAHKVAQDSLQFTEQFVEIDNADKQPFYTTKRGNILVFGGDEIYPYPTAEMYFKKFRKPYSSVRNESDDQFADMYAIPGNHDWYDGLGNFIKIFCQKRSIGRWQTRQRRSYFALPLPNNYWLWGTDIQLNSNIDEPQMEFFKNIAKNKMEEGDKIILVTAEPAWVYNQIRKNDKSFERLNFFVDKFVKDKFGEIEKKFRLALTLTGDLHHYARYCTNDRGHQYITAGGGGAFLHLTHNLPTTLDQGNEKLKQCFPEKKQSIKLLFGNFNFPLKNIGFTFLLSTVYFLFFWFIQSNKINMSKRTLLNDFEGIHFLTFFKETIKVLLYSPATTIIALLVFVGFYKFTDTNIKKRGAHIFGVFHAFLQVLLLFITMYIIANVSFFDKWNFGTWWKAMITIETFLIGGFLASTTMGIYLFLSNLFLGMHINEASSSLASPDYKNFLRIHIHEKGITIYPIGITKVQKKWKQQGEGDSISFEGDYFKSTLIEKPIELIASEI